MDNEFLHFVNLDLLQKELKMDVKGISELLEVSTQTIYKWNRDKSKGGCRPTYNALYVLFQNGATIKSLFGLDSPVIVTEKRELSKDEFMHNVQQALAEIVQSYKV